jgi:cytochrome c oxidase cbb3-type subunit 2
MKGHDIVEKNIGLMLVLVVVAISFGSLVEIVPQFFLKETTTPIEGLKPLKAVELEGRDIYIREGCHVCHTQMVRPLRAEVERYGHYSVAGESVYEHPFLWGSKRTGPDLARVGGRYSDAWQKAHLYNPRSVVPKSNMPAFPWLFDNVLTGKDTPKKMRALRKVGVPYTDEDIAGATEAVKGVTEIDALVAYLQQLGTLPILQQKR